MIEITDHRLVFMKEDDIMNATGFCEILKDKWFIVLPSTGELVFWQPDKKRKGSLKGASPQCNSNETVAIRVKETMYPWAEIKFFSRVACPIEINDYVSIDSFKQRIK